MKRLTQVSKDQSLTGGLEFFHVTTPVSIVPTADRDADQADFYAQARVWERVVEVLSRQAAPVIIGALDEEGFSFATEKRAALKAADVQAMVRELGSVAFDGTGSATVDLSAVEVAQKEFRLDVDAAPVDDGVGAGGEGMEDDGDGEE